MDDRQQSGVTNTASLQPPGQPPAPQAPESHRWLWGAMAALLLLGLGVIFALPRLVGPTHETAILAEPLPAAGDSVVQRDAAHQALQTYLQLRARLELENASAWGEPDWSEAASLAATGDRYFAQLQYAAAARDYEAALDRLQQLPANRDTILATALEEADRALAENDVTTAISRFQTALAIQPEHPAATRGLAQAGSRNAVIEQMNLGQSAASGSDLEAAQAAYRQALQLDADYAPAREALQQVTERINARDFNAAMTRALAALDAGRTGAAGKALAEAEQLQPGDMAVRDARQRLRAIQAQASLDTLRRQAASAVSSEDWQAAIELYRKALAIDPAAGFARTGLSRAEERVKLHAQIDHYLGEPARVYSAVPLENARQLLEAASEAPADEPRLASKISALRELVTRAGTPQRLTLNSDGATSVAIYHVGRLGEFTTRQMELLPGDYTIVGSRPGYRDVRKVVRIRPGVPLPSLQIRCEEKI
jgi:tetratricopeptide (TPR) repeat protein